MLKSTYATLLWLSFDFYTCCTNSLLIVSFFIYFVRLQQSVSKLYFKKAAERKLRSIENKSMNIFNFEVEKKLEESVICIAINVSRIVSAHVDCVV